MNQILICNLKTKSKFRLIFIVFIIVSIFICSIFCFNHLKFMYKLQINNERSIFLSENLNITNLYSSYDKKIVTSIPYEVYDSVTNSFIDINIIGFIEIPKINLKYPISETINDKNLNILPCKLCGPLINTPGNFCIAGHNFNNNLFFSNLFLLNKRRFNCFIQHI